MSPKVIGYIVLAGAILFETVATTFLKKSDQFTVFWPSVACFLGYGISFYLLSITLKTVPVGVAYAIWSAVGIVLISLLAKVFFHQQLDFAAWLGIFLIISGVAVIHLFSKTVA